tara:strand:+ start:136 stop:420 length:285 start_codon:yes stop_codon:yes gene_type:complete
MEEYKWKVIIDDEELVSDFKIGDLVTFSTTTTLDKDFRDINKKKVGLVTNVRFFYKEPARSSAQRTIHTVCEIEILWSPSNEKTYEREDSLIKV